MIFYRTISAKLYRKASLTAEKNSRRLNLVVLEDMVCHRQYNIDRDKQSANSFRDTLFIASILESLEILDRETLIFILLRMKERNICTN
ncbi:hypothetical protein RCL_jg2747.t1 [Rhizophagus clarus]|uniref:Uncharacterized protein n=1 Tax=Rhizophagus clarus TaxID=94130 RepID=A0A8H3R1A9_9GLOM|nr:hypothetical protein RCL_jg2747.t1 [Rhizophagus clarus]